MNEEICCITNKGKRKKWLWMNGKMMTLTIFELYIVYVKKLGEFFFHITC